MRRASFLRLAPLWLAAPLLLGGCQRSSTSAPEVRFGIFFGDELQEREEFPLVLDEARQRQGLWVRLPTAPAAPVVVRRIVTRPSGARGVRDAAGRPGAGAYRTEEETTLPAGQRELHWPLRFQPEDVPGTWNLQVFVGAELALDRPLFLYDPVARSTRERGDAEASFQRDGTR